MNFQSLTSGKTVGLDLRIIHWLLLFCVAVLAVVSFNRAQAGTSSPTVIFATSFEASEGYDPQLTLSGQNGWVSYGSGGSGIVSNFFEGYGQQAYVGFIAPTNTGDLFNVWRPINLAPINTNQPLVTFSVVMEIVDSTNGQRDDFRWSAYNTNGNRLFTLDFDNSTLGISYALDGTNFVSSGFAFAHNGFYELEITMNFARNLWTATLNNSVVVNSQPIATQGEALNLGDIDAVWAIATPGSPGNNYMLFDDYRVVSRSGPSIPPTLEVLGPWVNKQFLLRLRGEPGLSYAIEAAPDLLNWTPIKTNSSTDGSFDFLDTASPNFGRRFYRAHEVF